MKTLVILVLSLLAPPIISVEIPKYFQICRRNDPNVGNCLRDSLKTIISNMINGEPRFQILSLDPFFVPEVSLNYQRGPISSRSTSKNNYIHALRNVDIRGVRVNTDDDGAFHLEVDVKFPSMFVEGSYKAEGRMGPVPFFGKGNYNYNMTDVSATWMFEGRPIEKDGEMYMKIESFNMRPVIGGMKFYADNLFGGNKALSDTVLSLANEYWEIAYTESLPYIQEVWGTIVPDLANKILLRIPFNKLFPEN